MYWILREITYLVFWIIERIFCPITVRGMSHIQNFHRPMIIAANHEGRLDPIWISFGLRQHSRGKIRDIRYFVWHVYYNAPVLGWYIQGLRNFSLINKQGFGVLNAGIQYLNRNRGIVGIFPEGKIHKITEKDKRAKRGVAYLAWKSQASVIPMYLQYSRRTKWLPLWSLTMIVGEPIKLHDIIVAEDDLQSAADHVLATIYQLGSNIKI